MAASVTDLVDQAFQQKRHELVLTGPAAASEVEADGLDEKLFTITTLNFLEVSKCDLKIASENLSKLVNLTSLVLHSNKLSSLPDSIGKLIKLKLLDVSRNELEELPETLGSLVQLQTLDVGNNKLESLPESICELKNLGHLGISHNSYKHFPPVICDIPSLMQIKAGDNQITDVPPEIENLSLLKLLDLTNNSIKVLPGELGNCAKLKQDLLMTGNKLSDKRLEKLFVQGKAKAAIEYVRKNCPKMAKAGAAGAGKDKDKKKRGKKGKDSDAGGDAPNLPTVTVLHCSDDTISVKMTPAAGETRPFIVCCVIKNVNLGKGNSFKTFIALQTKIHDTVCAKRASATLATHDMALIKGNVTYDARDPDKIKIHPLFQKSDTTAKELYVKLRNEAEAQRREKKRNTYSGIHKYLYLLAGKSQFAFVMDSENRVISLPPLTNSDTTKISPETKDIFIEVTSSEDVGSCKKVVDALLLEMLNNFIFSTAEANSNATEEPSCEESPAEDGRHPGSLTVEQVRILDPEGQLKVVYPSRIDLQLEGVSVVRDYK
ncbi:PREDICTED: leucine-rich repeat-containing protein 47-like [Priapulus caudatus]|uniref:Leucine-rich repeat-containing protein 47-like n=1 Tax=Priapulus caudatus TaxID=37621 RepID=A0ABM1EUQ4_PRICU|nr:PREDICTED: leucine-rich repeat-containing protein 47-like [Priapulus caudatus]